MDDGIRSLPNRLWCHGTPFRGKQFPPSESFVIKFPKPQPVPHEATFAKRRPAAVSSRPIDFHAPSGLAGLVHLSGPSGLSHLSSLTGLLRLEAEVSRRGLRASALNLTEHIDDAEDLPEGRLLRRLPGARSLPWVRDPSAQQTDPRAIIALRQQMGPELARLVDRLRRDGISLAAVATRLRAWACYNADVEHLAISYTGHRYVIAVGLSKLDEARHDSVNRAMAIATVRFNGHQPSILVLGPHLRRSPHLIAPDAYRVWPA